MGRNRERERVREREKTEKQQRKLNGNKSWFSGKFNKPLARLKKKDKIQITCIRYKKLLYPTKINIIREYFK